MLAFFLCALLEFFRIKALFKIYFNIFTEVKLVSNEKSTSVRRCFL
mgnify:CR=1 FL=1